MKLEDVVPWGRTLKEYELMFNILEEDKEKESLDAVMVLQVLMQN